MQRSWKPTIAGILDLIHGSLVLIALVIFLVMGFIDSTQAGLFWLLDILFLPPGALAVVAGMCALRRKRWLVALVCSILAGPFGFLTTPAVILIALSKEEFGQPLRTA